MGAPVREFPLPLKYVLKRCGNSLAHKVVSRGNPVLRKRYPVKEPSRGAMLELSGEISQAIDSSGAE